MAHNENDNAYSEFLFSKKEEEESYVLSDEVSFFFTTYILYDCI